MSSTKSSLAFGVAPSPAFSAVARRCRAQRPSQGVGLSLAALVSVALWIAAGGLAYVAIVHGAEFVAGLQAA